MREMRVADASHRELVTRQGYAEVEGDLREVFLSAPSDELVNRHLADMLVLYEATRALSRQPRRRRRHLVVASSFGIGMALVAGAGVAGASGDLPDPVQRVVAQVVAPLGIDVPTGTPEAAPGRGGENPGRADEAPGQQEAPGSTEDAPGLGGENPGRSETAPGHSDAENNRPPDAPSEQGGAPEGVPPETGPPVWADEPGPPVDPGAHGENGKAGGTGRDPNAIDPGDQVSRGSDRSR
jgi:hypothetical protein